MYMHLQILSWQGTSLYILHVMLALSHIFTHLHHTTHWDIWPAGPWVNSLWPSDAIWWQGSGSTLAQVMACCLMAPSHYLSQCWLIISEVMWYSHVGNFTGNAPDINNKNVLQNYTIEIISMSPYFSGSSELKIICVDFDPLSVNPTTDVTHIFYLYYWLPYYQHLIIFMSCWYAVTRVPLILSWEVMSFGLYSCYQWWPSLVMWCLYSDHQASMC